MPELRLRGNILGELTAEADGAMLNTAFYESRNYRELVQGTGFSFVVGRRGTGKSALFAKVSEAMAKEKGLLLLTECPTEEVVSAWHSDLLRLANDYSIARKVTRLAWRVQLLTACLDSILSYYKSNRISHLDALVEYRSKRPDLFKKSGIARCLYALRSATRAHPDEPAGAIPELIAELFEIGHLQSIVYSSLDHPRNQALFLCGDVDEGWLEPSRVKGPMVGGFDVALLVLAADMRGSGNIHCLLFVRDNMFRALAEFGLFTGALGADKTFFLLNRDHKPKIASDLAGICALTYGDRSDQNYHGAVGAACTALRQAVKLTGTLEAPTAPKT